VITFALALSVLGGAVATSTVNSPPVAACPAGTPVADRIKIGSAPPEPVGAHPACPSSLRLRANPAIDDFLHWGGGALRFGAFAPAFREDELPHNRIVAL